jgi:hypothetical protein
MFFPLITRPTRITSHTATLIDNIFTNHIDHYSFTGLLFTEISDHLLVFCGSYYDSLKERKNKYTVYRDKSKTNLIKFQNQLNETVWENFPGYNDPKMALINKFTSIYDSSFPLKKIKSPKLNSRKPWVTNGLLKSFKMKNKHYRKYLSFPTAQNEKLYEAYKNKLTKILKNAKRVYYETKF